MATSILMQQLMISFPDHIHIIMIIVIARAGQTMSNHCLYYCDESRSIRKRTNVYNYGARALLKWFLVTAMNHDVLKKCCHFKQLFDSVSNLLISQTQDSMSQLAFMSSILNASYRDMNTSNVFIVEIRNVFIYLNFHPSRDITTKCYIIFFLPKPQ